MVINYPLATRIRFFERENSPDKIEIDTPA